MDSQFSVCVCVVPFYYLRPKDSTFADISLLLVDRNVFPKVRAVAASVQHLRNTHFPDLVMLTWLCEAVKKRGVAGWKREKQILGGQFWPAPFKCIVLKQACTSWWEGSGYASWLRRSSYGYDVVTARDYHTALLLPWSLPAWRMTRGLRCALLSHYL